MSLTTTLTLDDDLAAQLERVRERYGESLEETLRKVLRSALGGVGSSSAPRPFVVRPRALGARPGLDFDRIEELLDELEGPSRP